MLSILIVLIALILELPFYLLSSRMFRSDAADWSVELEVIWSVIFGIIILLNITAFFKIAQIKYSWRITEPKNDMKKFLNRIQIAAVNIIVSCVFIIALIYFFDEHSIRGLYSDPRCYLDGVDIAYRCSMFWFEYGCAVAVWFVAPSACCAIKAR